MREYLVYEMNVDTRLISFSTLAAKLILMGLMIFGYLPVLTGCILLGMTSVLAMLAYRPYRETYREYDIEFTD